ncbi:hypothetical protein CCS92_34475, partial [Methylobacterium radiotolerans]
PRGRLLSRGGAGGPRGGGGGGARAVEGSPPQHVGGGPVGECQPSEAGATGEASAGNRRIERKRAGRWGWRAGAAGGGGRA